MRRNWMIVTALLAVVSILCLTTNGCGEGNAADLAARPDLIQIDGGKPVDELERFPALFPHDLHTEALERQDKDCTTCHPVAENGRLSLLFMRLEGAAGGDVKDLYHERCIGCHEENAAAGAGTGPVSCGECHRQGPLYTSSRRPFGFDNSLHYRHIAAHGDKCDACHHVYDKNTQKLVYIEGRENPCRGCHRPTAVSDTSSFRTAAHSACIGCHRDLTFGQPPKKSGPQSCAGCHDQQRQAAIEVVENPPRLKRGQPDFVLLSAPGADMQSSKLNTVPFSHESHERFNKTCRVCHHESLSGCSKCHELGGSDEGGGVRLQQAMHSMTSEHSCVGCHDANKTAVECAGCHDLMEKGRLSEHACNICHAGPSPPELAEQRSRYSSLDDFRPDPSQTALTFAASELPDTVVIGVLADKYPPVKMPHRMILNTLMKHIGNSKIATHFHGHEDVLCRGCHHHGSVGRRPALCENCHGEPFRESDLFKPGLNGAYHRQCLGCHVSMSLQSASECKFCHGEKTSIAEGTTSRPAR